MLALAECNWRRVFISRRREIPKLWVLLPSRGVNFYEASPRSLFARRRSSALRASWGSAPDFVVPTGDSAMGGHSGGARPVAARNGAPIRRNTVWRRELSAEGENSILTRRPVVGEAKLTALWELRMLFGPRGSPPMPLEELPAEARAGLFSLLEPSADLASAPWAARSSGLAGRDGITRSI